MRILLISQFFAPDITAAAFRMTDFAVRLAAGGDEIRVLTSHPHKAQVSGVDDQEFEHQGIGIQRCVVDEVQGSGAKAYLKHYLSFVRGSIRLGLALRRRGWKPDVIYASSPPLFVGLTASFLATVFRRPIVFEVRDIWPDTAVAAGQLSGDGRAYRIGRSMERFFYRRASHLICVSQPMRDYLVTQSQRPVTVIYNGVEPTEEIAPATAAVSLDGQHRVVLYAGNLGHLQELDLLIRGFVQVQKEPQRSNWKLMLLGAGAQLEKLRSLVDELDAHQVVQFLPPVSRSEAIRAMSQADLLYLNLKHHPTLEKTIPSKLFDYFLAARPIVAGLYGEGRDLLESTGANVVFPPGNMEALQAALRRAIEQYSSLDERATANRDLVLSRFTREIAVSQLQQVLSSVAGQKSTDDRTTRNR